MQQAKLRRTLLQDIRILYEPIAKFPYATLKYVLKLSHTDEFLLQKKIKPIVGRLIEKARRTTWATIRKL